MVSEKIAGLSIGYGDIAFKLMRGFGIDVKHIGIEPPLMDYVLTPFHAAEQSAIKNGTINGYLALKDEESLAKSASQVLDTFFRMPSFDKAAEESKYIGLSLCDDFFIPLKIMAAYIGDKYGKKIVVGGPIAREATLGYMEKTEADFVNVGGLAAFLGDLNGKQLDGFYSKKNGKFSGRGRGSMPNITKDVLVRGSVVYSAPVIRGKRVHETMEDGSEGDSTYYSPSEGDYVHADIFGMTNCPNKCSYCCSSRYLPRLSETAYISAIKEVHDKEEAVLLEIFDDNPLMNGNIRGYKKIIDFARENFKEVHIDQLYVDPAVLAFQPGAKKFIDGLKNDKRITELSLFIGRECCDGATAEALGRRYGGRVRDDKLLARETSEINAIICGFEKENSEIKIGHIIAPYESAQSIQKRIDEFSRFTSAATGDLEVSILLNTLKAHPGTKVFEKFKELIVSPFPGMQSTNIDAAIYREFEKIYLKEKDNAKILEKLCDFLNAGS